jgi:hypothetical protein
MYEGEGEGECAKVTKIAKTERESTSKSVEGMCKECPLKSPRCAFIIVQVPLR